MPKPIVAMVAAVKMGARASDRTAKRMGLMTRHSWRTKNRPMNIMIVVQRTARGRGGSDLRAARNMTQRPAPKRGGTMANVHAQQAQAPSAGHAASVEPPNGEPA
jgi:hypothetical protein